MKLYVLSGALLLAGSAFARNAQLEIDLTPGFMRHVRLELPAGVDAPRDYLGMLGRLGDAVGCPEKAFVPSGEGVWVGDCDYAPIMRPPVLYDVTLRLSDIQTFLQLAEVTGLHVVVRHRSAAYSTIPQQWEMETPEGDIVERSVLLPVDSDWPDLRFEVGYRWQDLPATLQRFWPVWAAACLVLLWPAIVPLKFAAVRYWGSVGALAGTFAAAQVFGLVAWINTVGHHPAGLIVSWAALIFAALLTRAVGRWGARAIKHPIQCWMPPVTDKLALLVAPALMVGVFAVAPSSLLVVSLSVVVVSCCAVLAGNPLRKLLRGPVKKLSLAELTNLFSEVDEKVLAGLTKLPGLPVRLWKDASRDEIRAYYAWCMARSRAPAAEGSIQWIWFLMLVFAAGAGLIFLIVMGWIPADLIGWSLAPVAIAGGIWYSNWRPKRDLKVLKEAKRILGSSEAIEQCATRLRGYWSVPLPPAVETVQRA